MIKVSEEFLHLISINSPSGKEGQLANYLKERLTEFGAIVFEDDSTSVTGSDTGNLVAQYPGDQSKPSILLAAHMDTIASTEGMVPQIKDGVIYSDGKNILGADDKAGIAVILGVLSYLQEDKSISHGPVEILFTVKEETGLIGIKNLGYSLQSKFGYVLDGDGPVGTLVNASPSHIMLDLTIEGKAAHAGLAPESGINAIVVAARAIGGLNSGRLDEETTSNFGIINGGKGRNIVADQVEVKAEVRSRNRKKLDLETDKIIGFFQKTTREHQAGLNYNKVLAYDAFAIDPKHPVLAYAIQAGEKLGLEINIKATGGGLDANILNARGVTCVALGLGNDNPHTNEEYAVIDELEKARQFLLEIIKQVAM